MRPLQFLLAGLVFLSPTHALLAEEANWPGWRGPNQDGVSTETSLLQKWPAGGPPQEWLFEDCGLGYSGPAILGNRLYILGARNGEEQLICLQASDGKELWSATIGPILENAWGNGPRSTPTVDGEHVYALGGQGNLVCFSSKEGSQVWSQAMQDLGGSRPVWGYSESPTVHGEKILCTPGGEEGAIVALDKISGDLLWQTSELTDIAHYSSIVVTEHLDKQVGIQILVSQLVGLDLENGHVLWTVPWQGRVAVIPTPLVWKDKVYVTAGYGVGCMMVQMGDDHTATLVYDNHLVTNQHGGVIRLGENIFGHSDKKGWTCQLARKFGRKNMSWAKGQLPMPTGGFTA